MKKNILLIFSVFIFSASLVSGMEEPRSRDSFRTSKFKSEFVNPLAGDERGAPDVLDEFSESDLPPLDGPSAPMRVIGERRNGNGIDHKDILKGFMNDANQSSDSEDDSTSGDDEGTMVKVRKKRDRAEVADEASKTIKVNHGSSPDYRSEFDKYKTTASDPQLPFVNSDAEYVVVLRREQVASSSLHLDDAGSEPTEGKEYVVLPSLTKNRPSRPGVRLPERQRVRQETKAKISGNSVEGESEPPEEPNPEFKEEPQPKPKNDFVLKDYFNNALSLQLLTAAGVLGAATVVLYRMFNYLSLLTEVTRNEQALKGLLKTLSELEKKNISSEQLIALYDSVANNLTLITDKEKQIIRMQLLEQPFAVKQNIQTILSALQDRAKVKRSTHSAMQRIRGGFAQDYQAVRNWFGDSVALVKRTLKTATNFKPNSPVS